MAVEICEYVGTDQVKCGQVANPCSRCQKAFCPNCFGAHFQEAHPSIPELNIEPDAPPAEAQNPTEPAKSSPFDPLFVDKDKIPQQSVPTPLPQEPLPIPEEPARQPEESVTEEQVGKMFSAEMDRVVEALNKLARQGLNPAAVIALIHDAEPKIPKSTIATVLKTLRQLPDLYGREGPGRKPL